MERILIRETPCFLTLRVPLHIHRRLISPIQPHDFDINGPFAMTSSQVQIKALLELANTGDKNEV